MKYSSYIDNQTAMKWGLTVQQAVLFDWIYSLPSWADSITSGSGKMFYHASKNLACSELPLLTNKPDTIYRYYKQLEAVGLIELEKFGNKDFICLTKKTAIWGRKGTSDYSEINPNNLGNKSESNSEINPTYNNTISNKNTKSNYSIFPDLNDQRKTTFSNSPLTNDEIFEKKFENEISAGIDVWYYRNSINDWCETLPERTKSQQDKKFRTAKGWVSTLARAMRTDKDKGKLKMMENKKEIDSRFSTLFNEV